MPKTCQKLNPVWDPKILKMSIVKSIQRRNLFSTRPGSFHDWLVDCCCCCSLISTTFVTTELLGTIQRHLWKCLTVLTVDEKEATRMRESFVSADRSKRFRVFVLQCLLRGGNVAKVHKAFCNQNITYLSICLSVFMSVYVYLSTCISVYLPTCLPFYISMYFYKKNMWNIFIHYMVLGFEPTTFRSRVFSHKH